MSVMGDMDGEMDGDAVVGAIMGEIGEIVQATVNKHMNHGRHHGHHGQHHPHHAGGLQLHKPQWRNNEVAPGVHGPDEGLEMLPLTPDQNGGIFTASLSAINFVARPQRPFQGERMVVRVGRVGTSSAGPIVLASALFVGTQPQMLEVANFDLETFVANAFGVRLKMSPAQPGVLIKVPAFLSTNLSGSDTIALAINILGHSVR